MSERDDDVVERADALMRRRRFVAITSQQPNPFPVTTHAPPNQLPTEDDLPVLTEVISADDDVPVLTDALPASEEAAAFSADAEREALVSEISRRLTSQLSSELGSELAQAVERRLAAELPTLIEAVMLDVGTQLRAGIAASVGDACRDFVRRHASPTDR